MRDPLWFGQAPYGAIIVRKFRQWILMDSTRLKQENEATLVPQSRVTSRLQFMHWFKWERRGANSHAKLPELHYFFLFLLHVVFDLSLLQKFRTALLIRGKMQGVVISSFSFILKIECFSPILFRVRQGGRGRRVGREMGGNWMCLVAFLWKVTSCWCNKQIWKTVIHLFQNILNVDSFEHLSCLPWPRRSSHARASR